MNEGSDDKRWWDIISVGCPRDVAPNNWSGTLSDVLKGLPPDEIVRFDHWMDQQTDRAYHRDLWQAAVLINGGASDDGFYYFRLWLLGMGKAVFEAAIEDPDSLADVVDPDDMDCEAGLYGAAASAWFAVTGNDPIAESDAYTSVYLTAGKREYVPLRGEAWLSTSPEEYRRRLPRLWAHLDDLGEAP